MKSRTAATVGSTLLLAGALFPSSCDDRQIPQTPGVEEPGDAENQDEGNDPREGQDEDQDES